MGYMHLENLYRNQLILSFKECYALEKIHGTSAHISWKAETKELRFSSGGESHVNFCKLFDENKLRELFSTEFNIAQDVTIYGEAYGGKQQGMSSTYGTSLKFAVFDVNINGLWLDVPKAEKIAETLGMEFVHYVKIPTTMEAINTERDKDSTQAVRNGVGPGKIQEGVVLRPLFEVRLNCGSRVMAKHKRDEFRETASPRVVDEAKLKVLEDAKEIADEWVTEMRLTHVLDKLEYEHTMENTKHVIFAMIADIRREAEGEIVFTREVESTIGKNTAVMFKKRFTDTLNKQ